MVAAASCAVRGCRPRPAAYCHALAAVIAFAAARLAVDSSAQAAGGTGVATPASPARVVNTARACPAGAELEHP